jgi:predicted phosphodiesterase
MMKATTHNDDVPGGSPGRKILLTADLHQVRPWYDWLRAAARDHDIVCIAGDLLDGFHPAGVAVQALAFDRWCRHLPSVLAFCSGNHDAAGDLAGNGWPARFPDQDEAGIERMRTLILAHRWMECLSGARVVADGESRVVATAAGSVVLTTIPFQCGGRADALWKAGEGLRAAHGAPWLVLHHEPPAGTAVGGRYGDAGVLRQVRLHRPDFLVSGHIHAQPYVGDFAEQVGNTWCFNPGYPPLREVIRSAQPNHIVLDLGAGTATWDAAAEGARRIRRTIRLRP